MATLTPTSASNTRDLVCTYRLNTNPTHLRLPTHLTFMYLPSCRIEVSYLHIAPDILQNHFKLSQHFNKTNQTHQFDPLGPARSMWDRRGSNRGIITSRCLSNWGLTVEGVVAERRRLGAAAESRCPFEKHLVEALLTTTIYVGSSRRVPSEFKESILRGSVGIGPENQI